MWSVFVPSDDDLGALHESYAGRVFIHDEDISVDKQGVPLIEARASEGVVYASGICVGGDALFVENNAAVVLGAAYPGMASVGRVDSVAKAFGMSLLNGGVVMNNGSIEAGATGETVLLSTDGRYAEVGADLVSLACGMWATRSGQLAFSSAPAPSNSVETDCLALNRGVISVSSGLGGHAAGSDATYQTRSLAYGIYSDANGEGVNTGQISATATGGMRLKGNTSSMETDVSACGVYGKAGSVVINTGGIIAKAYGDRLEDPGAAGSPSAAGTVRVQAMGLFGGTGASVVNVGEVVVTADGGDAGDSPLAGAYGLVGSTGSQLVNIGTISVSARSCGTANAYGIVSNGDSELYSTGAIEALASSDVGHANAYAVYAADGRLAVKVYGVHLADDPQILQGVWAHSASGFFDLTDATLYVSIDEETPFETPYRIDRAVSGETHTFSRLDGAFPEDISLVSVNNNESILLRYAPTFNPATKALRQTTRVMDQCVDLADEALMNAALKQASADTVEGESSEVPGAEGRTLFLTPFAIRSDGDAYESEDRGICAGGTRSWGRDTLAGVHFVLGRGQQNFDPARLQDRETRMTHAAIGVQGLHRFTSRASLRLSSTFFYSTHDFEDKDPRNLEEADYKGQGLITRLAGRYDFSPTANFVLSPEIGLRHEWVRQDAFTTDHMSWMGTHYSKLDENELYGEAALNWRGHVKKGATDIHPQLRLFAEQVLTGGTMSGSMALADHRATVADRQNNPSFGAQLSAEMTKGIASFVLGYTGRIEEETTQQSGWVTVQVAF
ncbi:autotransporter outer membrane beta-barrel domain-containing protein [Desulfoluna sp.]|uniref:autotransporter outer membrane beta-barrel domain-containing protein n=1 Tax=Desulfoluna sp. TaxID=2045199 RepID=UPI00262B9962|nr:autotransporter outer membrane beta-barrel domain-containing protein [Desulfoluna sp.]